MDNTTGFCVEGSLSLNRLIRRALGSNGAPAPLPGLAVSAIRSLVLEPRTIPVVRGLQVGDTAVLIDGPFAGHRAKVRRINQDRSTVAVAMTLFGSLREVDCPMTAVELEAAVLPERLFTAAANQIKAVCRRQRFRARVTYPSADLRTPPRR